MSECRVFLLIVLLGLAAPCTAAPDAHWFLTDRTANPPQNDIHLGALPARFALLPNTGWHSWGIDGGYESDDLLRISAHYFDVRYSPAQGQTCGVSFACAQLGGYSSAVVSGFSARLSQGMPIVPALSVYGSLGLMRMDWRFPQLHELESRPHAETMLFRGIGVRYRFHRGPWIELDSEQFQVDMSVTRINFTWQP